MATATRLSLEEFHRLYDGAKPAYEYWFGEAIQKPMPTNLHSALQLVLGVLLRARGWFAFTEARIKLAPNVAPVPDLIASREALPKLYATKPFELCVEILSPGDRLDRTILKAKHYLDWGIQHVWIVDPESRAAWMLNREHPDGMWVHPNGSLAAHDTEIPLAEIFDEVDKMII